jgi:hypothetical protein
LFACFVAVMVTWMRFASDARELRRGSLSMLETHIVMSYLIFHHILTLVLHHAHLLMLCLISLMDLTITHIILVHKRTTLHLDTLVMAHILIVVIFSHVGMFFSSGGSYTCFETRHLDGLHFSHRGSRPTGSKGEVQNTVKIPSCRMVKCWISKIYLTNPRTESSTSSHLM